MNLMNCCRKYVQPQFANFRIRLPASHPDHGGMTEPFPCVIRFTNLLPWAFRIIPA
jgi:hypothetical protein